MTTMSLIKGHIHRMTPGEIFTTRDLLNYGTRAAIDSATYLFVRSGRITRLARGVFVRTHDMDKRKITVFDIASTKAIAFAKNISNGSEHVKAKLGLKCDDSDHPDFVSTFTISGRSSSLRSVQGIIKFASSAPRKMILGNDIQGDALRALWSLGKWKCKEEDVATAILSWNRLHKENLRVIGKYLPQWLHKFFYMTLQINDKKKKAERRAYNKEIARRYMLEGPWF